MNHRWFAKLVKLSHRTVILVWVPNLTTQWSRLYQMSKHNCYSCVNCLSRHIYLNSHSCLNLCVAASTTVSLSELCMSSVSKVTTFIAVTVVFAISTITVGCVIIKTAFSSWRVYAGWDNFDSVNYHIYRYIQVSWTIIVSTANIYLMLDTVETAVTTEIVGETAFMVERVMC